MLNFRNTTFAFVIVMISLIVYDYFNNVHWIFYAIIIWGYSLLLFYGSYFIQSNFFVRAICNGDPVKKEIAITFDDGPHAENTPQILKVLDQNKTKAAFFCIGKNMVKQEQLMKEIYDRGHVIGNHSFSHSPFIDFFSLSKWNQDVLQTDELIYKITGRNNFLFRPPYGVTTPVISKLVKLKKYKVIGWSLRSYDTAIRNQDKLMKRILSRIKPGVIILLHDTTPGIEIVLKKILDFADRYKYKVVGLQELLNIKAYE